MRILLDECLPRPLSREITNHEVVTVPEMGWAGLSNGKLLALMQNQFDAFITVDRNIIAQLPTPDPGVAVLVLHSRSNRLADLRPLVPEIQRALKHVQKGQVIHLGSR